MEWRHKICYVCLDKFDLKTPRLFPFCCDHSICSKCFSSWSNFADNRKKIKCGMCESKLKPKSLIATKLMTVNISDKDSISIFCCESNEWKKSIKTRFNFKNFLDIHMQDNVQKYIIDAQIRNNIKK